MRIQVFLQVLLPSPIFSFVDCPQKLIPSHVPLVTARLELSESLVFVEYQELGVAAVLAVQDDAPASAGTVVALEEFVVVQYL